MLDQGVLRERNWTEAELVAAGFQYYPCRKRAVMARELPAGAARERGRWPGAGVLVKG